jgi:AraC family transcriptional regulator of adaptative response/methylated-DNA-[protein]-cysteine methyltransferase
MRAVYTITDCPLGRLLVAATEWGVCAVNIGDSDEEMKVELQREYPHAKIHRDDEHLRTRVEAIVKHLRGEQPHLDLSLDVQATAFQQRVWEELRRIPYGQTRSYAEIAHAIGKPNAYRAVARACATNPVPLIIPCHRVVRSDGSLGGYGLGLQRKRSLLEQEGTLKPKRD